MTLLSSTITNWAAPSTAIGSHTRLDSLSRVATSQMLPAAGACGNGTCRCGAGVRTPGKTPARKVARARAGEDADVMHEGPRRYGLLLLATLLSLAVQGTVPPSAVQQVVVSALSGASLLLALRAAQMSHR